MAHFTSSDGKKIYFEDNGKGKPLVCLAGLTRSSRDFTFLAPHVPDLRLIAIDYRGRGQSDHDPNYMNYNVNREGQDVIELLDHLGLGKVTVLGTSRGGLIAMVLADCHQDRLAGVILNDVGPIVEPTGIARIFEYVGKPPTFQTFEDAAQVLKDSMEPQFPGVPLSIWRKQAENQYLETPTGLALSYDVNLRQALLEQAAAGPPPDLWPLIDALRTIPTGVIRGMNSDILSPGTLAEMRKRHPALVAEEVPDRGHAPFLDEPQSLAVIRNILEAA